MSASQSPVWGPDAATGVDTGQAGTSRTGATKKGPEPEQVGANPIGAVPLAEKGDPADEQVLVLNGRLHGHAVDYNVAVRALAACVQAADDLVRAKQWVGNTDDLERAKKWVGKGEIELVLGISSAVDPTSTATVQAANAAMQNVRNAMHRSIQEAVSFLEANQQTLSTDAGKHLTTLVLACNRVCLLKGTE